MRVLLADDQKNIRLGLRILLENEKETCIVGEAENINELLFHTQNLQPDILLLDWELCNLRIAGIIPMLRFLCPKLSIIALSVRNESRIESLTAGVDSFVSKGEQPEKLLEAINEINYRKSNIINTDS